MDILVSGKGGARVCATCPGRRKRWNKRASVEALQIPDPGRVIAETVQRGGGSFDHGGLRHILRSLVPAANLRPRSATLPTLLLR